MKKILVFFIFFNFFSCSLNPSLSLKKEPVIGDTSDTILNHSTWGTPKNKKIIEEEIESLGKEFADLEDIWKNEKAMIQGAQSIKDEIDKLKSEIKNKENMENHYPGHGFTAFLNFSICFH